MDRTATTAEPTDPIIEGIACRLDANRVRHRASGDAYVVSVYGEWGIGKTRVLKGLYTRYDAALERLLQAPETDANTPLVIPVLFEAWRYEHEEHLVVPLLKTIEFRLRQVGEASQKAEEAGRGEHAQNVAALKAVGSKVLNAGKVIGRIAYAFANSFKLKASLFGAEVEFTAKDAVDAIKEGINPPTDKISAKETGPQPSALLANAESLYFDSHRFLEDLTGLDASKNTAQLAFVVLIDDLDRCLPEKAVQVLESVKLFLNVAGFSFVLAVDDEVVERGIAHRYKDYLQPDAKHNGNGNGNGHTAPISGAEYLEKIVHLPVHLPRWTEAQARAFLQQNYPDLFGTVAESSAADVDANGADKHEGAAEDRQAKNRQDPAKNSDNKALLDLVVTSIPLVPRKLVRLAEALQHQQQQFVSLGAAAHWRPRHMARLIALQQLYPALYRHIRLRPTRYWRMFSVSRNWLDDPYTLDGGAGNSLRGLQELFKNGTLSDEAHDKLASRDQLWEQLTLLEKIQSAKQVRGAPDPITLFKDRNSEEKFGPAADCDLAQDADCCNGSTRTFADLYLHGVAPPAAKIATAAPDYGRALPRAQIDDIEGFVSGFCSIDNVGRRELIETRALVGKRLPDAAMTALLKQLSDDRYEPLLSNLDWLSDCARIMSPEQLLRLYIDHKVLEKTYNDDGAAA
jgi:hypothetical protein